MKNYNYYPNYFFPFLSGPFPERPFSSLTPAFFTALDIAEDFFFCMVLVTPFKFDFSLSLFVVFEIGFVDSFDKVSFFNNLAYFDVEGKLSASFSGDLIVLGSVIILLKSMPKCAYFLFKLCNLDILESVRF